MVDQERAVLLGHPSYVWRAGQERRLTLVRQYVPLDGRSVLDVGCGLGMYAQAFGRYTAPVYGTEFEHERAAAARERATGIVQAVGEALPFASGIFDLVFSNEVIEHVADDRRTVREMVRVTRPRGHVVVFCPNRLWPFETHGFYWRDVYHFGNIPLINYLPSPLRDRLAPHVRVYTRRSLLALWVDLPVQVVHHQTVYPGFDNVVRRFPRLGPLVRTLSYAIEEWPVMNRFGLSHFAVLRKHG